MIAEQLNFNHNEQLAFWEQHHHMLNDDQKGAYDRILQSVENDASDMFMINGHSGTGKTFLYKVICSKLWSDGAIILCTASSGIVALLLPGSCTAHLMVKIPIDTLS